MKELISKIKQYNLQVITVTQDLTDLKNVSEDTGKAIIDNCNAHIKLPLKSNRTGMGVSIIYPDDFIKRND
ncbi:TraM recognition domain-containing protein [Serratia entomophila]|uniref:TraM recognition domain-containing protein n=1 Tax=Serratia entomophila TaxID=42906 RepID=UPI001F4C4E43|nr:TraM recognition domain-containing protein [Serratia entomophila]ULG11681.1 hypothetical protein 440p1_00065 [Serratia entomophila]ULG11713.1 hypothetical protein 442p_00023 [Serratia entomophila]